MCSLLLTTNDRMEINMIYIGLGILVLLLDIITKISAERVLTVVDSIPLIQDIFHLTYVENKGIAFGIFSEGRIFFIITTVIILTALIIFIVKTDKKSIWLKAGSTLVISGAVGNLIERITKGYVVDFLDFRIINFPVFNVADIAVCIGAFMLLIHFLKTEDKSNE